MNIKSINSRLNWSKFYQILEVPNSTLNTNKVHTYEYLGCFLNIFDNISLYHDFNFERISKPFRRSLFRIILPSSTINTNKIHTYK